jgi:biopolymer transport protein ExbD
MADIHLPQKQGKRRKLTPPRIDLTPMVDLGFLLITFFILTTTMTEKKVMEIYMPVNGTPSALPYTSALTIIPASRHRIQYYEGFFKEEVKETNYKGIRDVIIAKQNMLKTLPGTFSAEAHKLHVIIKPHELSQYEDLVKVLDEMLICDVPYYTIDDITKGEVDVIPD